MPQYDYKCPACGHEEIHWHSMTKTPILECEKCKAVLERKLQTNLLIYGGRGDSGGFYNRKGFSNK